MALFSISRADPDCLLIAYKAKKAFDSKPFFEYRKSGKYLGEWWPEGAHGTDNLGPRWYKKIKRTGRSDRLRVSEPAMKGIWKSVDDYMGNADVVSELITEWHNDARFKEK